MRNLKGLLAVAAGATALLLTLHGLGLIERLELITLDARYTSGVGRSAPREDVVIAWIDQESMDYMDENGFSFPWPRSVYEAVLGYLNEGGARAVAFDLLFDQRGLAEDDEQFAAALEAAPNAALALKFVQFRAGGRNADETARLAARASAFGPLGSPGTPRPSGAPVERGAVLPLDDLEHAAQWLGFVNIRPDADKVYRRYDVARAWSGDAAAPIGALPSLAAAALLAGGADAAPLKERDDQRFLLNFRGPDYTFEHVKFVNLFVSMNNVADGLEPVYPAARFKDKYVLIGIHAEGYEDIHPTPLSRTFPGVELHATALDNLLAGDALREVGDGRAAGVLGALLGVAAVFALPGVVGPSLALAALLAALIGGAFAAFGAGYVVPLAAPALGLALGGAGSFVWRVAIEGRERREMKRAFSSYMAPEVLAEVLAHPEHVALGGEAREVTLFFSDLAGFTGLAEHIGPEALVRFLNDYFTRMCEPLLAERGVIDKFIGDAIMALFGAPLRGMNHAHQGVRAALLASDVSAHIAAELRAAGRPAIETRIGVHTGPAIVGNMGSAKRFDYTAIGDTVNLASRLEGANKAFGTRILVSETTWSAGREGVAAREVGLVGVKGREAPIRVFEPWALEGDLAAADRALLGRHDEALVRLRAGDAVGARAAFEALAGEPRGGALAARYAERLALAATSGEAWDGVWRLDAK
ncbi:MAG: adenylate/guanylate cyclase domain-containing protein [Planctomycetota bacterium]